MSEKYVIPISEEQKRTKSTNDGVNESIAQLQRDVAAEKTNRENADTTLTTAVNALSQRLTDADAASNSSLNAVKDELNQKIDSNVTRIDATTSKLTTDLTAEIGRAKEAEAALNTSLTQRIETEQTDRAAADVIVAQGAASLIQQETTERKAADDVLTRNLTNEIQVRTANETSIRQTINQNVANLAPKASPTFTGTVKIPAASANSDSLQAANVGFVNAQVKAVNDKVVVFQKATATADGKEGLVPAQGKTSKKQILTSDGWANMDAAGMTLVLPSQSGTLTYNRGNQTPTWNNYDSNKLKLEVTAQTNAGTYKAKFTPLGLYVWSDTEAQTTREVEWKIEPMLLPKPTASVTSFTFNNANQGITVSNYDSTYMTQSGTISARDAKSYSATYTLNNTNNTKWTDGTTGVVTISWSIAVLKLPKPVITGDIEFDYDKEVHSVTVLNYDSTYMTQGGTISSADAGEYNVTYTIKETSNVHWADNTYGVVTLPESGKWKIIVRELTKPTIAVDTFDFTYTNNTSGVGDTKSIVINNYEEKFMTVTGTQSASDAGVYTVTFTLKDEKYSWEDKSKTPITRTWTINRKKVAVPTLAASEATYTGAFIYIQMTSYGQDWLQGAASGSKNYAWTTELASGMVAVKDTTTQAPLKAYVTNASADPYEFSITPNKNHCWTDGSTDTKVYQFKVNKTKITAPTMTGGGDYKGSAYTVSFTNFNSDKMNKSGTETATNAGTYRVTVSLKNPDDYQWDTTGDSNDLTFTWTINRAMLTEAQCNLYQATPFTYNGNTFTFTPENFNTNYFTIVEGNTGTNAGTYFVTVSVNANYYWYSKNKVASEMTADRQVEWVVNKDGATLQPFANPTVYKYTGNPISLQLYDVDTSRVKKVSGDTSATACGAYSVTYELIDPDNFKWSSYKKSETEQVSITWSIEMTTVAVPAWQTSTFTYASNTSRTPTFTSAFDSDKINVTGDTSAIDAGVYYVTCSLKNKNTTTWTDGTTDDIVKQWTINRAKLTATQSNLKQSGTFTYDGTEKELAITNFNATYHTLKGGTTKAIEAGTYKVTVSLTSNYAWSNGTITDRDISWTIKQLELVQPTVTSATSFVYDGDAKELSFSTFNTTHIAVSGTTSAVNENSYTCKFSLKNTKQSTYWKGASSDTMYDPITVNWNIYKETIAEPTITNANLSYSASGNVSPSFSGYDSTTMTMSGDLNNDGKTGTFTVTIALKDKATKVWAGTHSNADLKFNYVVAPMTIESSVFKVQGFSWTDTDGLGYKIYNDKTQTAYTRVDSYYGYEGSTTNKSYTTLDTNYYITKNGEKIVKSISGTLSASDAGVYSVTVTLTDNAKWWDAANAGGSKTLYWKIMPKEIGYTTSVSITDETEIRYTGSSRSIEKSLTGYDSNTMTLGGQVTGVDEGIYLMTITPKKNYCWKQNSSQKVAKWSQQSVGLYWEILPKKLDLSYPAKPDSSLEFTGDPQTITLKNSSNKWHTLDPSRPDVIDDTSAISIKKAYIESIDVYTRKNYCFKDGTTKKTIWFSWKSKTFGNTTGNKGRTRGAVYLTNHSNLTAGTTQSPTLNGFDEKFMSIRSGSVTSASAEGFYTIIIDLKTTYDNGDGTTADISNAKFNWYVPDKNHVEFCVTAIPSECKTIYLAWAIGEGKRISAGPLAMYGANRYQATANHELKLGAYWDDEKNRFWYQEGYCIEGFTSSVSQSTNSITGTMLDDALVAEYITIKGNTIAANTEKTNGITASYTPVADRFRWSIARTLEGLSEKISFNWYARSGGYTLVDPPYINEGGEDYYDGNTHSVVTYCENPDLVTITGTTSAINAGTYTLTYKLNDKTSCIWSDTFDTTSKTEKWKIERQQLGLEYSHFYQKKALIYSGSEQTADFKNYVSTYHSYVAATRKGTECGDYVATIKTQSNYCFNDGTTETSANWSIIKSLASKPTAANSSFAYAKGANPAEFIGYDEDVMTVTYKRGTTVVTSGFTVGSYTATFALKDKANGAWIDNTTNDVVLSFSIVKRQLLKPTAKKNSFVYNGKSYSIGDYLTNYDSDYMELGSNTSATDIGNYTATLTLNDTSNTVWADNSTSKVSITWSITPKPLSVAQSTFVSCGEKEWNKGGYAFLLYDGSGNEIKLSTTYISPSTTTEYYNITEINYPGDTPTRIGDFTCKVTPTSMYCWNDGTTDTKTVTWITLVKRIIPIPYFSGDSSFTYDGNTKTVTPVYQSYTGYFAGQKTMVTMTGTTSTSVLGTYTLTFALPDKNCSVWADNTTANKTLTWSILVDDFPVPSISGTLTYNGNAQSPAVSNFVDDFMEKSSQTSMTDAGTYKIVIKLKDKTNTKWTDGTTADKTLTWSIGRKSTGVATSTGLTYTAMTYNGSEQTLASTSHKVDFFTYGGTTKATNAGNYTVTMTPKANYCWSDGSFAAKSFTWTINKAARVVNLSSNKVTINSSNDPWQNNNWLMRNHYNDCFTIKINGETLTNTNNSGISMTSSNSSVIGIYDTGNVKYLVLNGNGTTTITVTAKETDNYIAINKIVTFTVSLALNDLSWKEIKLLLANNKLTNFAQIGDTKTISGDVKATLIGLNHNKDIEGDKKAHFAVFNTGQTAIFRYYTSLSPYSYEGSDLQNKCTSYYESLPSDLQSAIVAIPKYATSGGNGYGAKAYTDNVWCLSVVEVSTDSTALSCTPTSEKDYSEIYEYFANGNKISTTVDALTRTRAFGDSRATFGSLNICYYIPKSSSTPQPSLYQTSHGFVPCFAIG